MLYYCKKCGRIMDEIYGRENPECDYCSSVLCLVPEEFLDEDNYVLDDEVEERFREEYVKKSPEFDQYLFDHRDEYIFQKSMEMRSLLDTSNKVTCPYCHSVNVRKLPKKSLFLSNTLFGGRDLSQVGKNFHCNKCGADF